MTEELSVSAKRERSRASRRANRPGAFAKQSTYYLEAIIEAPDTRPSVREDAKVALEAKRQQEAVANENVFDNHWSVRGRDLPQEEKYRLWVRTLVSYKGHAFDERILAPLQRVYEQGKYCRSTSDWRYEVLVNERAKARLGI